MERSRIIVRKDLFLLPLMAISIGLVGVEKSYAWGKTWMGRDLELWVVQDETSVMDPPLDFVVDS